MKPGTPQIQLRAISTLVPYERNARTHSAEQIAQIAASIREFGWTNPVLLDGHNGVIAGHARLAAARQLGLTQVPCIELAHLTDAQKRAYILADNRLALNAGWDLSLLASELQDLKAEDFNLDLLGFDSAELDSLLTPTTEGLTDPDDVPEVPVEPVTQTGNLWLLGKHRLLCGDATKREDVERVIAGEKVDMVFTDPPYGIGVVRNGRIGGDKAFGKNGFDGVVKAGVYAPIIGDDGIETAVAAFEIVRQLRIKTVLFWGANNYAHKVPPARCWVIWDKQTDGNFGDGEIAWCSAAKSVRIFRHKWSGMLRESERDERRVHPTQKPVALADWAFTEFIPMQKCVLDPFLGSGSTLIACEKTNRTCLGMELSPAYCDVIITRWQNFIGHKATLDGTNQTFDELKEARTVAA